VSGVGQILIDWRTLEWSEASREPAVRVTAPSAGALLDDLDACLRDGRGFAVATLNLDHLVKFRRVPAFAEVYASMTHVTADGNPIVWLSRLAGQGVELAPGSELVEPVSRLAATRGVSVGLFGSTEESLSRAAEALKDRVPGLTIAFSRSPPMGFDVTGEEADRLIREMAESGARVIFLALGAPKQEFLAARILRTYPEIGTLSIGAGLDFLSGAQSRAPRWVRELALEWLWRLGQNPARMWRRYRDCFAILPGLTAASLRLRMSRQGRDRRGLS
jgi:exopolysaccharide biosynthesis WecB/TagA/CpsF family protein